MKPSEVSSVGEVIWPVTFDRLNSVPSTSKGPSNASGNRVLSRLTTGCNLLPAGVKSSMLFKIVAFLIVGSAATKSVFGTTKTDPFEYRNTPTLSNPNEG